MTVRRKKQCLTASAAVLAAIALVGTPAGDELLLALARAAITVAAERPREAVGVPQEAGVVRPCA